MDTKIPSDEVMLAVGKLAFEEATERLAALAEGFSHNMDGSVTAAEALMAFAMAIRETNKDRFKPSGNA
jgi:hypothetical protein